MSEPLDKFYVFADDLQAYGPANSELLQQWAREGLVSSKSWIFHQATDFWCRAAEISSLKELLVASPPAHESQSGQAVNPTGLKVGQLRRIRLFADMSDDQVEKFLALIEKVKVRGFAPIVRQGEHGDSMFLILEGEARVTVKLDGKEDTIATLGCGDFFGELSLLDAGPRSADVTANKDCTLLKLTKSDLEQLIHESPELASRFLLAMNRFLGVRLRATNERFSKAQNFSRGASGQITAPSAMKWNKG